MIKFLASLSIRSATDSTFKLLVGEGFDTLQKIDEMTVAQIASVGKITKRTIGEKRAEKIFNSWHSERIQACLQHSDLWVKIKETSTAPAIEAKIDLSGKNIVFTGTCETHNRAELTEVFENAGANIQKSVNSKTDLLILSDLNSNSGKAKKATSLDVKKVLYIDVL